MKFKLLKNNKQRGFTLVEALVAVLIFSVSVVFMMVVLSDNVSDLGYAKDKVVATYLAQEGLEYVRNVRDTYMLYSDAGTGWPDFVAKMNPCDQNTPNADGCYYDPTDLLLYGEPQPITQTPFIACAGLCPNLKYSPLTLDYDYSTGSDESIYRRTIKIQSFPGQEEMYIYSTVSWKIKNKIYELTFSENLFNWAGQ